MRGRERGLVLVVGGDIMLGSNIMFQSRGGEREIERESVSANRKTKRVKAKI